MSHLRLLPKPGEAIADEPAARPQPELAERINRARAGGSIEAALHMWGARVRAERGADVAWRTTRPPWHTPSRIDNWRSPVWLPTAQSARSTPVEPFQLASLFERAA